MNGERWARDCLDAIDARLQDPVTLPMAYCNWEKEALHSHQQTYSRSSMTTKKPISARSPTTNPAMPNQAAN